MQKSNQTTGIILFTLLLAMVGLSFASVPLYRIFCQQTGYGGTPKISASSTPINYNRKVKVRFAANVAKGFPLEFRPSQTEVDVFAGESGLAFYKAKNVSDKPLRGMATYNVTPAKAAIYFSKIECFCFVEQTFPPGEEMDMPVQFFIDAEVADDLYLKDVKTVTLFYNFFPLDD